MITRRPEAIQPVPVDVTSCRVRRTFALELFGACRLVSEEFEPFVDNPWTLSTTRRRGGTLAKV
jgi:hypothetical protein